MPPMWYQLIKILVLLFALFTTIVCINSEISKRREAEAAAATAAATLAAVEAAAGQLKPNPNTDMSDFTSDNLLHILRSKAKEHQGKEHQEAAKTVDHPELEPAELPAKDLNQTINDIFKVYDAPGVHIFNGTNPATVTMPDQQDEAQRTRQPPENPIVFPDSAVVHQMRTPEPPLIKRDIPQCVEDQDNHKSKSFCTEVQNYPDLSRIKGKLSQNFSNFFSDPEPVPMDISSRLGPNDEVFLCRSHRRYLYPKSGLKSDNTWQFIVNNEEFKQGILIEECENEDMPCDYSSSFPQRYKPICKQHYVMRMLASIRNTSGEELDVAQESFKIPSCCKCVLKVL
ncbi:protein spaetzle isoform X8 [Drosophila subobscura]|uniref:protein spaetzle isoform X8 n=1 Tax=Drosophila subobscura TaxID=7241 RepID=UPI00155B1D73|nr:protein spaetzle isoform X8 [Drosophila subobscura]